MSLVVEDGTGRSDSESYISVADADAYFTARGNATWPGTLTTGAKEVALRQAADYLEARFAERWVGSRVTTTQALAWPRYGVELDGVCLSSTAVPTRLARANAELAVRAIAGELMPDQTEPGAILSESVTVGPISTSTTYSGGKSQSTFFRFVDALVTGLIYESATIRRA